MVQGRDDAVGAGVETLHEPGVERGLAKRLRTVAPRDVEADKQVRIGAGMQAVGRGRRGALRGVDQLESQRHRGCSVG